MSSFYLYELQVTLEALISPLNNRWLFSIYINLMLADLVFWVLFSWHPDNFPELLWSLYYQNYSESKCIGDHLCRGFIKS